MSRYAFDQLLLDHALALGSQLGRDFHCEPTVIACGRQIADATRSRRLFGFKAHFDGPADDAVELFFFDQCYVGLNSVEGGRTNVCGLGPEDVLKRFNFDYDAVVAQSPALAARLKPLSRSMKWLSTGPLRFHQNFERRRQLSGGRCAVLRRSVYRHWLGGGGENRILAGIAAARSTPVADYLAQCRAQLKQPFEVASLLRKAVNAGWADHLAGLIPGRMLFALTRPRKVIQKAEKSR